MTATGEIEAVGAGSSYFCDDAEIARLVNGFLERSLPKEYWTHAAHFAATLWLLRHRRELELETTLPDMIRTYNESVGGVNTDTSGYHETITLASIRAARQVLERYAGTVPLHRVANDLMAGELGRSDWLLVYWSRPRLFSVEARRRWTEPDLQALPF